MARESSHPKKTLVRNKTKAHKDKGKHTALDSLLGLTEEQQAFLDKKFVTPSTKKIYLERFAKRKVLIERGVKLTDLKDGFELIPRVLDERQWEYFALSPITVYIEAIRDFYCTSPTSLLLRHP